MLSLALLNKLGIHLSESSVRHTLQQLGLRWRRPRLRMPDKVDPQKARKQWAIAKAIIDAPDETVVVYADESRLQLLPLLRAMWQWAGQHLRIPTPGNNVTRTLFGALNILTGQWTYLVRQAARTDDFLAFLDHLLKVYPTGPIILIVDNFSSHTAHTVADWLRLHARLQLFYLPLYCSHLNPVEPSWLRLNNESAANRLYASMSLLLASVAQFFHKMTPQLALQWTAS
jgi:transposase